LTSNSTGLRGAVTPLGASLDTVTVPSASDLSSTSISACIESACALVRSNRFEIGAPASERDASRGACSAIDTVQPPSHSVPIVGSVISLRPCAENCTCTKRVASTLP
jgi:hypothetical protein